MWHLKKKKNHRKRRFSGEGKLDFFKSYINSWKALVQGFVSQNTKQYIQNLNYQIIKKYVIAIFSLNELLFYLVKIYSIVISFFLSSSVTGFTSLSSYYSAIEDFPQAQRK